MMSAGTLDRITKKAAIKKLQTKADILDELAEFIEDKRLGYLMSISEQEEIAPLVKANKILEE